MDKEFRDTNLYEFHSERSKEDVEDSLEWWMKNAIYWKKQADYWMDRAIMDGSM